jgi:hypothetical protein
VVPIKLSGKLVGLACMSSACLRIRQMLMFGLLLILMLGFVHDRTEGYGRYGGWGTLNFRRCCSHHTVDLAAASNDQTRKASAPLPSKMPGIRSIIAICVYVLLTAVAEDQDSTPIQSVQ